MLFSEKLPLSPARANLRRLAMIRIAALSAQILGTVFAIQWLDLKVPKDGVSVLFLITLVFSLATLWRLRLSWPVGELEYFLQLVGDVILLSVFLVIAGGSTNPFISYYLVLLTIAAATLQGRQIWILTLICVLVYTGLMLRNQFGSNAMMPMPHHSDESIFNLHVMGMWVTFIISAMLITSQVSKMAQAIRSQDANIAAERENILYDEQVVAIATLAAGTAHELGTPLSTMSVLISEIAAERPKDDALMDDLQLLQQQVSACKMSIQKMIARSEAQTQEHKPAAAYLKQLMADWQLVRPEVNVSLNTPLGAEPCLSVSELLNQALINLLNNAADASPERVEVDLSWEAALIHLRIRDFGSGIPMSVAENMGKPFISTKGKGLGIGLFLSNATIARANGEISVIDHAEGGTLVEVTLPVVQEGEDPEG